MPRLTLPILVALAATVLVVASGSFDSGGSSNTEATTAKRAKPAEPKRKPPAPRPSVTGEASSGDEGGLSPRRALGQLIVARFTGANPGPAFLDRVRAGEIGGVILFEENLSGGNEAIAKRIGRLQMAAAAGGNTPLLTMVDQEGGPVRRLRGPPRLAPRSIDSGAEARAAGEETGKLLRRLGIEVDLAPVADIGHHGSFLGSRVFSSSPAVVADRACEFAAGLHGEGVAATLKHFPGLGTATASTDQASVTIDAPPAQIRKGYAPYRACGSQALTLVMVDSAVYPNLTGPLPAVMSPLTYSRELPLAGASGVTISDALESPSIEAQASPALGSIEAGLDLLLYAKSESTSAEAYRRLLEDTRTGALDRRAVALAAARVLALKEQIASA